MKNILKTFGLLLLSGTAFVACDDYLDRQPDEQLTAAQIFQKAKTTEQYLTNVYGYQSNYSDPSGQILPWSCCDDDGSIVFTGRNYSLINYDTWNPNNDIYRSQTYNNLYKGIREANYFMQHVFECPEMSEIDKGYHYNEARFLRAYYYSLLMSAYGPVFLIGDDPVDSTQEGLNERERNTWEECINYVANELWETSKGLPDVWTGETANYGRATKGAALAIRSRMLLYSARKLFNGNDLYKGVIDKYGNQLFPTVYSETGFSTFTHPIYGDELKNTFMMYQNREPRFYINVFWSGMTWHSGNVKKTDMQFYNGGNSGYGATQQNYTATGYLAHKFIDYTRDTATNGDKYDIATWGYLDWPIIRYAEILLNYVEALNEYDPGNPDILTYLNMVRKRAGVPDIDKVYPEAVGNQTQMRELIRRERHVELCYENLRYFDIRTWMTAETEHGDVYGMNVDAKDHKPNGDFWKRTLCAHDSARDGHRKFSPRGYLFPISQEEMDRTNCTQNYGW